MPGFFCPSLRMACKLKDIKTCGFAPPGVLRIALLEYEDLEGLDISELLKVNQIQRSGDFTELMASTSAKYSTATISGGYSHTLETSVPGLGEAEAELWKASKKEFFVVFANGAGQLLAFGYDSPASLSFQGGTDDGAGYIVTLSSNSKFPPLVVGPSALQFKARATFVPDFENGAFCML